MLFFAIKIQIFLKNIYQRNFSVDEPLANQIKKKMVYRISSSVNLFWCKSCSKTFQSKSRLLRNFPHKQFLKKTSSSYTISNIATEVKSFISKRFKNLSCTVVRFEAFFLLNRISVYINPIPSKSKHSMASPVKPHRGLFAGGPLPLGQWIVLELLRWNDMVAPP